MAPRRTLLTRALVLAVCVGFVSAAGAVAILTPAYESHPSTASPAETVGAQQLSLAATSLRTETGPSSAAALSCTAVGVGSDRCANPTVADAASTPAGGYAWTSLTTLTNAGPSQTVASMAWDPGDNYVLLFGGENNHFQVLNDTWTYFGGTWTNITSQVSGAPAALVGDGLAYAPFTSKVILFGGIVASGAYQAYTYGYHGDVWTNLTSTAGTPPSPRAYEALSTDTQDGQVVLFGGQVMGGSNAWVADTWTLKNGVWKNVTSTQSITLPPMYFGPILLDDPGKGVFLYGAADWDFTFHPTTYLFTGGLWQNLTPSLTLEPPMFYYGGGAYVSSAVGIFVYGGWVVSSVGGAHTASPQTWEFAGGAWSNVTEVVGGVGAGGAPTDYNGGSTYLSVDNTILSYGGMGTTPAATDYFWALAAAPTVTASASLRITDVGLGVRFIADVSGGLFPNSVLWNFGDGTTSTLTVISHSYTTPGLFQVNVTATSLSGSSGSGTSLSVYVNPAPTATLLTVPSNPAVGYQVVFVPIVLGGTAPITYAWSFGDGGTSTSTAPSHAYTTGGVYVVTLNVTDSLGVVGSATGSVTVGGLNSVPPASTAPGPISGLEIGLIIGIVALAVIAGVLAAIVVRKPRPPATVPPAMPSPPSPPGAT